MKKEKSEEYYQGRLDAIEEIEQMLNKRQFCEWCHNTYIIKLKLQEMK